MIVFVRVFWASFVCFRSWCTDLVGSWFIFDFMTRLCFMLDQSWVDWHILGITWHHTMNYITAVTWITLIMAGLVNDKTTTLHRFYKMLVIIQSYELNFNLQFSFVVWTLFILSEYWGSSLSFSSSGTADTVISVWDPVFFGRLCCTNLKFFYGPITSISEGIDSCLFSSIFSVLLSSS